MIVLEYSLLVCTGNILEGPALFILIYYRIFKRDKIAQYYIKFVHEQINMYNKYFMQHKMFLVPVNPYINCLPLPLLILTLIGLLVLGRSK